MQPVTRSRTGGKLVSLRQCVQRLDLVFLVRSVENLQWVHSGFVNGRSLFLLFQPALVGQGSTGWNV